MLTVLNEPSPRKASRFDRTAVDARYTSGFYELEADNFENFRWMGLVGRIDFEPQAQAGFAEFRVWSEFFDLRQHLTVEAEGAHETFELPHGWWTVSLPVPAGCSSIVMRTDRQLPQSARPGDTRQLGVRIGTPRVHRDSARHRTVTGQLSNAVRNTLEAIDGRAELRSTPTSLGIDMYGVCNVKPPCFQKAFDEALVEVGRPFAAAEPLSTKKRESPRQVPEPEPSRPEMSPAATLQAKDDDATIGGGKMPVCLEPWKSLYNPAARRASVLLRPRACGKHG